VSFKHEAKWSYVRPKTSPHVTENVVQVPHNERSNKDAQATDDELGHDLLGWVLRTWWETIFDEVGHPSDRTGQEGAERNLMIDWVGQSHAIRLMSSAVQWYQQPYRVNLLADSDEYVQSDRSSESEPTPA
jgi:hypothetical protein